VSTDPAELVRLRVALDLYQTQLEAQSEELRGTQDQLREAHDRTFELFDLAPVGYVTLDERGVVGEANRRVAELLGSERRRLVGFPFVSHVVSKDAGRFKAFLQDRALGRRGIELDLRAEEGNRRVVLDLLSAGSGAGLLRFSVLDLTQVRAAQHELVERRARLDVVLETVQDGIVTVGADRRVESLNRAAEILFGRSNQDALGMPLVALLPGFFLELGGAGAVGGLRELVAKRADGSTVAVEVSTGSLPVGDRVGLVAVVRDVSERKRRESELRENLARFRQIAEGLEDALYIAEASTGRFLYVSPAFERNFGRSFDSFEGGKEAWIDAVHEDERTVCRAWWEGALRGVPFDVHLRIVRPDGSIRFVRHRCFPLLAHDRLTGIVQDVTAERQREEHVRQLERLEALGVVAGGVAHDFNNLLMGLAGTTGLALRALRPEDPAYRYLQKTKDIVARGTSITGRLLRFVGRRPQPAEAIDLEAEVQGARELVERLAGERVHVTMTMNSPGAHILAQPGEIEQALVNLATNARDAMPEGGDLVIETRSEGPGRVALSVRDSGVGMEPSVQARIFDPFFTTKEIGKGTGLGLPIVLEIIQRLRGTIDVESAPGRGTTFTLHLPVHERTAALPAPEGTARGQGRTVLIVDDEPLVATTVRSHLETLGYRALAAGEAAEARRLLEEHRVDVLLTDIVMPGLLGTDLAREVRPRSPELKVLYMSAHPREELVRQGRLDRDAPLLEKPFDERALDAALERVLAEPGPLATKSPPLPA
jgi:PAS domain S-box-containing protein